MIYGKLSLKMRITFEEAVEELKKGGIIALPTETVYGLAASIYHPESIINIFLLKGRPADNPLIVHVSSIEQAKELMLEEPEGFKKLTKAFWPGPLTLVVPAHPSVPKSARAGLPTIGIRMPKHPLAKALIEEVGPLVAPSANLSGKPSATEPKHIEEDFGEALPLLDGGASTAGIESTILIRKEGRWHIARKGAITEEELSFVLEEEVPYLEKPEKPLCPGSHYRHYAPHAKLYPFEGQGDVIVGFSDRTYLPSMRVIEMGCLKEPASIAKGLYRALRMLDEEHIAKAWVDLDFPHTGILDAVHERLSKALKEST